MSFFKRKEPSTPSEKANRSLLSMIARLGACAYLIYIVVQLVIKAKEGVEGISAPMAVIFAVVLGVAAVFFAVVTLIQFFRGLKNQDYSMHKYYAEDLAKQGLRMNEYGEYVPLETPEDEDADVILEDEEDTGDAEEPEEEETAEPEEETEQE